MLRQNQNDVKNYDFAFDILVTCITNRAKCLIFSQNLERLKHAFNS